MRLRKKLKGAAQELDPEVEKKMAAALKEDSRRAGVLKATHSPPSCPTDTSARERVGHDEGHLAAERGIYFWRVLVALLRTLPATLPGASL